jgi:hypothetical protein
MEARAIAMNCHSKRTSQRLRSGTVLALFLAVVCCGHANARTNPDPIRRTAPAPSGSSPPSVSSPSAPAANRLSAAAEANRRQPSPNTFYLLGGTWYCTTYDGIKLTHVFSRPDGISKLLVATRFHLPGNETGTTQETYRHNARSNSWTANVSGRTIVATAPDWTGPTWDFVGQTTNRGKTVFAEMIYTRLGDDSFRREFRRYEEFHYLTYAGEMCRRPATF